jgi:hypothetical protein
VLRRELATRARAYRDNGGSTFAASSLRWTTFASGLPTEARASVVTRERRLEAPSVLRQAQDALSEVEGRI